MTSPTVPAVTFAAVATRKSSGAAIDSALFYGIVGLLLFGPLASGAVQPWSEFILEAGAVLLSVVWTFKQAMSGDLRIRNNPLFLPMLVFGTLIAFQFVTGRTAYRAETLSCAIQYGAYGLLCFLAIQCLRRSRRVKTLALVFSAYGFAVALFALLQDVASNGNLYWVTSLQVGGWIYGPYVNHNHYAGLMELLTPIPLVIFLSGRVQGSRKIMAATAATIMASTIFLSGSRGGMAAFSVQAIVLMVFLLKRKASTRTALAATVLLVLAVGMFGWLGTKRLAERLTNHSATADDLSTKTRLTIDHDGLKMFAKRPVFGWGLGSFPAAYPQFRSFYTNSYVDRAHNDYLQLLIEMGLAGFATMLWFVSVLYRRAIEKLRPWPSDLNAAVALAALLGTTGILVHSLVDFNLQIPANAALFYVLCVIAVMEPRLV